MKIVFEGKSLGCNFLEVWGIMGDCFVLILIETYTVARN
jgi:hypothetical protein